MRQKYLFVVLTFIASSAFAQMDDSLGGYNTMEIEADRLKGNFATGAIEEMTGGVKIRLLSDDPSLAPLPIQANSMKFTWAEGRTTPTTILMESNVRVNHPDASVSAERAEWDFDSGALVFSGNPEVNSERLKGLRGEKMVLNLKTNTFEVTQVRADQVPLQTPEGATRATAPGISEKDIGNWRMLIDTLKAQAQSAAPSPGKQILAQMSEQNRQLLTVLDTELLLERKEDMLRLINSVLPQRGLYDEAAWSGVELPSEALELLASEKLDAAGQARLNRLLLEAAYPFAFTKP